MQLAAQLAEQLAVPLAAQLAVPLDVQRAVELAVELGVQLADIATGPSTHLPEDVRPEGVLGPRTYLCSCLCSRRCSWRWNPKPNNAWKNHPENK